MAKRLSYQQLQILKRLRTKPQDINNFLDIYSYSNLYRALNLMRIKGLIIKNKKLYEITLRGMVILNLYH